MGCIGTVMDFNGETQEQFQSLALARISLGSWVSWAGTVLDYWYSPDDLDGSQLVGKFGDRALLLGLYHVVGGYPCGTVGRDIWICLSLSASNI